MTVETDIVERKNEENLKISKQMEDTMNKLISEQNDIIAPITLNDDDTNNTSIASQSEIQRFYGGKNVFITGGTGECI